VLFLQTLNLHPNKQNTKINNRIILFQETEKQKNKNKKEETKEEKKTYFKCCNNLQKDKERVSRV
jgi:hypothetical protein